MSMRSVSLSWVFALVSASLALGACKGKGDEKQVAPAEQDITTATAKNEEAKESERFDDGASLGASADKSAAPAAQRAQTKKAKPKRAGGKGFAGPDDEAGSDDSGGDGESASPARSWFPETFLFEPLVVTDNQGRAEVPVRVPDRLTSWRVLALAHSRGGAQAGATTSFLGSLETYVDPVVPPFLRVGDSARVAIAAVNTTDKPVRTQLRVSADGGSVTAPPPALTIPARGSTMVYATVRADKPGELELAAGLAGGDSVVRSIDVTPVGKPVEQKRTGTLAAPRTFALPGPKPDRVRLQVFPGARAILRSELAASIGRGGIAEDAFALLIAGRADELLGALGDKPDAKSVRKLSILATQRVVRHARTLDTMKATLLAPAALAHPDNPIVHAIGLRAVGQLERTQLPDGTCGGETGWTLQRLLVATAACARAAKDSRSVVIRASGAFERHRKHIKDAYTAAAVLAAGGASGALQTELRALVRKSLAQGDSGARYMKVPKDVVNLRGRRPGVVQATALAALALQDDPEAKKLLPDLGATLLSNYSGAYGWGDGYTNMLATEALVLLLSDPVPAEIKITLRKGDTVVARGELSGDKVRDVLTLEATEVPNEPADSKWTITAEPAVAGLGFAMTTTAWTPWPAQAKDRGVEISAAVPAKATVGRSVAWPIRVAAAAGVPLEITLPLPAGLQIDRATLDQLQAARTITSYELDDSRLLMRASALEPGATFAADLVAVPTIAGALQADPATARAGRVVVRSPSPRWLIKTR